MSRSPVEFKDSTMIGGILQILNMHYGSPIDEYLLLWGYMVSFNVNRPVHRASLIPNLLPSYVVQVIRSSQGYVYTGDVTISRRYDTIGIMMRLEGTFRYFLYEVLFDKTRNCHLLNKTMNNSLLGHDIAEKYSLRSCSIN